MNQTKFAPVPIGPFFKTLREAAIEADAGRLKAERKAAKRKAWLATSPGHIARPLRHIRNRCSIKNTTPKGDVYYTFTDAYHLARHAANGGNGLLVSAIARTMT